MTKLFKDYGSIVLTFGAVLLLRLVLPRPFIMDVLIFGVYAMAFNFLMGHLGLVSFGQPAYLGLGAYGAALYLSYIGTNPYVGIIAGIALGLVVSMLVGLFLVKLSSSYFTLANLAFCAIVFFLFQKGLVSITRGDTGLWYLFRMTKGLLLDFKNPNDLFIFVFVVAVLVWLLFRYLDTTVYGASCLAAKLNETKLQFLGYNTFRIKWLGFVIANGVAALAGSLYAVYFGFVSPGLTELTRAAEVVIVGLLGGVGTLLGPIVGALVYIGMKDLTSKFITYWELVVGLLLIFVMLAGERGIVGTLQPLLGRLAGRRATASARAGAERP
ncbi:MAG: branched-chain amino acid ABC transporter permease [Firmicutes bacterium]|jgi:branched-chain amino acid transport system permease protein|nr:branched-chain amino acid ABC transporter permease [Bacillota bacterium]MDH7496474.1 branched-chain amino acid ABC transporter permease [Bacillota bacterium]